MNPFYEIIGQSSDHTVVGLKKEFMSGNFETGSFGKKENNKQFNNSQEQQPADQKLKPGSILQFGLDYFGLLSCMTSPFVEKRYVCD